MRLPLKIQIVAPLVVVTVATVAALAVFQAVSAARRSQERIERQLTGVAQTLQETNFPLTQPVLAQMKGLSGAEFVFESPLGTVFSTLALPADLGQLPHAGAVQSGKQLKLRNLVRIGGRDYYHVRLRLAARRGVGEPPVLHIFYSQDDYRRARREAVFPSAILGSVAVLAAGLCGVWIARNVCRSVSRIGEHVERVAAGDFRPVPGPMRDDELGDLAKNVNVMAGRLVEYEEQVRRTEQLRTLGQLGAGLAHEIRNAATGSRMALQIHGEECPLGPDCESLEVATRQLRLIENYVQRFLRLSKPPEHVPHERVDLVELVEEVAPLVGPHARHVGVALEIDCPPSAVPVSGDAESLGQVLLNLLFNAVQAVADPRVDIRKSEAFCRECPSVAFPAEGDTSPTATRPVRRPRRRGATEGIPYRNFASGRIVTVRVRCDGDRAVLAVEDHGAGPSRAVGEKMFDPFVSDKVDGVGLGLSVSREIVRDHGGNVEWRRVAGTTTFLVSLPLEREDSCVAQSAGY